MLLVIVLITSACAPTVTPAPVSTDLAEQTSTEPEPITEPESITLEVWYLSQGPEEIQLMESLSKNFEGKNPGVTVKFTAYGWEEMNTTLKLALSSGTGPDIAYAQPGEAGHVSYTKAGTLLELSDLYTQMGWDKYFAEDYVWSWQKQLDGIYGIPYDVNVYGVFYNKTIFDEYGLTPPETLDELEQLLATLKDNGVTPFAAGGAEGWPFMHYWQTLSHVTTPIEKIEAVMYNKPGVSFEKDGFGKATEILDSWVKKGYFNEGFLGASYADENDLFVTGEVAMVLTGSWISASYLENSDFEVRLFPWPKINPDIAWHGLINPNNVWIISNNTDQKDIAVKYMDYMLSEEVALARWKSGVLPGYKFDETPESASPLLSDLYDTVQKVGIGYSFNANLPGFEPYCYGLFQKMAIGELEPMEVMVLMDQHREELLADLE
jgi:raffinose/stachyose/melibiose transport system substrate-binding protein